MVSKILSNSSNIQSTQIPFSEYDQPQKYLISSIQKREWTQTPLASAIGTFVATFLMHPLDTIKVRVQSHD